MTEFHKMLKGDDDREIATIATGLSVSCWKRLGSKSKGDRLDRRQQVQVEGGRQMHVWEMGTERSTHPLGLSVH